MKLGQPKVTGSSTMAGVAVVSLATIFYLSEQRRLVVTMFMFRSCSTGEWIDTVAFDSVSSCLCLLVFRVKGKTALLCEMSCFVLAILLSLLFCFLDLPSSDFPEACDCAFFRQRAASSLAAGFKLAVE